MTRASRAQRARSERSGEPCTASCRARTIPDVMLADQSVETLVVDVIETRSMQRTRAHFAGKATADQAVDKVVRLLPVCDAGETAVLALDEDARMQHDGHEEPRLALGEPERLEVGGAFLV